MVIDIFDLLIDQVIPEALAMKRGVEQFRALGGVIGLGEKNFNDFSMTQTG
jgi:hypothetical protein